MIRFSTVDKILYVIIILIQAIVQSFHEFLIKIKLTYKNMRK